MKGVGKMIIAGNMFLTSILGLLIFFVALMALIFNKLWGVRRKRFIIAWIFVAIMGLVIFGLAWYEKSSVSLPKNSQIIRI